MTNLQRDIRNWWNTHPMVYDGKKTLRMDDGNPGFFAEIDRRFFEAAFFAQRKGEVPFSGLIDYKGLKDRKVLEIGCGAGALAGIFSQQDILITAIDMTCQAAMYTKRRFRTNRLKGNILQMDAETLGFKDASFDFIWSWGVIHHSEDTERIVSEIYRVLKPGGKAAIMVYNKDSIHFWISLVIIRGMLCAKLITHSVQEICNRYSDGLIAKYYTPGQIKKIFRSSGFNEIKVTVYGQKADCYPLPHNLKMRIIPFIPGSITNWLAGNFGRFIYLTALKPA